jgi:hypothetical protein
VRTSHLSASLSSVHFVSVCDKTVFFECFPYVCPEPVLVKSSFLYINGAKRPLFHLIAHRRNLTATEPHQINAKPPHYRHIRYGRRGPKQACLGKSYDWNETKHSCSSSSSVLIPRRCVSIAPVTTRQRGHTSSQSGSATKQRRRPPTKNNNVTPCSSIPVCICPEPVLTNGCVSQQKHGSITRKKRLISFFCFRTSEQRASSAWPSSRFNSPSSPKTSASQPGLP